MAAIDEREISLLEQTILRLERELAQARANISAQEDRRIELAHQLATALNDLGRAERRADEATRVLRHLLDGRAGARIQARAFLDAAKEEG